MAQRRVRAVLVVVREPISRIVILRRVDASGRDTGLRAVTAVPVGDVDHRAEQRRFDVA